MEKSEVKVEVREVTVEESKLVEGKVEEIEVESEVRLERLR